MIEKKSRLVYSTEKVIHSRERRDRSVPGTEKPLVQKPVYIRLERKGRCGKAVIIISGLQESRPAMEAVLKLVKSRLGTGGTIKGESLEIQGDHRDAVGALLQGMGYRTKQSGG